MDMIGYGVHLCKLLALNIFTTVHKLVDVVDNLKVCFEQFSFFNHGRYHLVVSTFMSSL